MILNICTDCYSDKCVQHDYNGAGDPESYVVDDSLPCSECGE